MRKGEDNWKDERTTRRELSGEQESAGAARERTTATSGNIAKLVQTESKKRKSISHQKTRYDRRKNSGFLSAN
jgi:hypothetical protein